MAVLVTAIHAFQWTPQNKSNKSNKSGGDEEVVFLELVTALLRVMLRQLDRKPL